MELINIKTFIQVVESGSVAKAAQTLQYAQSTVTAQVKALEKELGFPLFERIGRKNYLTNEGNEFLRYANELNYIFEKVSNVGHESKDTPFSLRIGVLQSLLFCTLIDVIPVFKKEYPNAQIFLKTNNTLELLNMLQQNQIDLAYISSPLNTDSSLVRLYSRKENMVFVSGTKHELVGRKNVSLDEVLDYPFVLSEPFGQSYQTFCSIVSKASKPFKCSIILNDIVAISKFLRDNESLSFLSYPSIMHALKSNKVAIIDVDMPESNQYSQILVRKNMWVSSAINALLSLIKEHSPEE